MLLLKAAVAAYYKRGPELQLPQFKASSARSRKLQGKLPKDIVTECFIVKLQLPQLKASSPTSRNLQLLLPKDRVTEGYIMKLKLPQLKTSSAPSGKLQLLLSKERVTEWFHHETAAATAQDFLCHIQEAAAATFNG
jgi:hypothetical protein